MSTLSKADQFSFIVRIWDMFKKSAPVLMEEEFPVSPASRTIQPTKSKSLNKPNVELSVGLVANLYPNRTSYFFLDRSPTKLIRFSRHTHSLTSGLVIMRRSLYMFLISSSESTKSFHTPVVFLRASGKLFFGTLEAALEILITISSPSLMSTFSKGSIIPLKTLALMVFPILVPPSIFGRWPLVDPLYLLIFILGN